MLIRIPMLKNYEYFHIQLISVYHQRVRLKDDPRAAKTLAVKSKISKINFLISFEPSGPVKPNPNSWQVKIKRELLGLPFFNGHYFLQLKVTE